MSRYIGKANLSSTADALILDVPNDATYSAIVRLSGVFVGTVRIYSSTDLGATYTNRTVTDVAGTTQADPTAVGLYAIDCTAGADYVKVAFSAYTSGTATAEVALFPQSA